MSAFDARADGLLAFGRATGRCVVSEAHMRRDDTISYPSPLAVSVSLKVCDALVPVVTVLVHACERRLGRLFAWTMRGY